MSSAARADGYALYEIHRKNQLNAGFLISSRLRDRGTLSVANRPIRYELGLSVAAMGALLSAFSGPMRHLAVRRRAGGPNKAAAGTDDLDGRLVDRPGAGWVVTGYAQFIVARALLGVGEAPRFPTAARVVKGRTTRATRRSALA